MRLIRPSFEILTPIDRDEILKRLELAGRTCYKSEDKITPDSASRFVDMICQRNHESVLEHASLTIRFVCDRGVSHELVRHRIASFSQESTRYVNYAKKGIEFVIPPWIQIEPQLVDMDSVQDFTEDCHAEKWYPWFSALWVAEVSYNKLIASGWKPECARSVLPNSLKTEIVVTANLREWRHILKLRTSMAAHPQMRELMMPLHNKLVAELPEVFSQS